MPTIAPTPALPLPGVSATRPEAARVEDTLRRGARDGRVGGFLPRLQRYGQDDQADNDNAAAKSADGSPNRRRQDGQTARGVADESGDSALFLAQVIGQDENAPKEAPLDPFGQATQAYARRAGPDTVLVFDQPIGVDISV